MLQACKKQLECLRDTLFPGCARSMNQGGEETAQGGDIEKSERE